MPYSVHTLDGRQKVTLEGRITIRHAEDFAEAMREVIKSGNPVDIETSGLEDIDTCILQLLCSLRKTVRASSFEVTSDVFLNAAERCGLRHELLAAREIG